MKAKVVMSIRSEPVCEHFESERLGIPGWQCIDTDSWEGPHGILCLWPHLAYLMTLVNITKPWYLAIVEPRVQSKLL
jgi:hypothetical protein